MAECLKLISKHCTQKILEQMNNCFNKIKETNNICFFTKIKIKNIIIPVIIASYQIINYIANNNKINVYINNELIKIELGKIKYFNKNYELAIIQIKENNKINYLELDDYLYLKESEFYYNKESIYIINCNNKNDIYVAYKNNLNNLELIIPSNLNKDNINISLIFNLANNKLIGLYDNNSNYRNKVILFDIIINEFINEYKTTKIENYRLNEIDILIKINKNKLYKEIYFLDKQSKNKTLEELNDKNTELYINGFLKDKLKNILYLKKKENIILN